MDTDIVIDFLRRREYAQKLLGSWAADGLLAVSTITHLEVFQGMKKDEEEATTVFLQGLISVAVDVPIARRAGRILGELRSKGVTVDMADSIIAATALEIAAPIVTNNVQHYPLRDLTVVRGLET